MMDRTRAALLIGGVGLLALALFLLTARLGTGLSRPAALGVAAVAAALVGAALFFLWHQLALHCFDPLDDLDDRIGHLLLSHRIDGPDPLGQDHTLVPSLARLVERLRQSESGADAQAAEAKELIRQNQVWLSVVLKDLDEGVAICSPEHKILSCNPSAARLLGLQPGTAAGQELFGLITREPMLHALALLRSLPDDHPVPFTCATQDSRTMLQGRLAMAGDGGYVVSFVDSGRDLDLIERDIKLRKAVSQDLRRPIANLRAAAETVRAFPEMTPRERAAFDEVVVEESAILSAKVEALDQELALRSAQLRPMADIHSQDLVNCLARQAAGFGTVVSMDGIPLWLHGESGVLLDALRLVIRQLAEATGKHSFTVESLLADRNVYLEISWNGPPVTAAEIARWLPLDTAHGGPARSLGDILDQHESDLWCQTGRNGNHSALRMPLPAPNRAQFAESDPPTAPRPEYHDLALMRAHCDCGQLGSYGLGDLDYVVFDCETTGLRPDQGDAIVQIGAVRVRGRRVVAAETFDRLVAPGFPIPLDSTRYHGITDTMVQGKPPIGIVLPQFLDFAKGAVLVGHNAAFDLKFLSEAMRADQRIEAPVLDTLLLALFLDPYADPSLDTVARDLGLARDPHRGALADARMTAEILVRQIDRLETRGLVTLADAVKAAHSAIGASVAPTDGS